MCADSVYHQANILIVDDEPNNLKVLHSLLAQNDYDVRAARDGKSAIEAAKSTRPDLILLDIKMPEMDGYEVCQHLKTYSETEDIPVIFISALNSVNDIVDAFEAGGVDYVTKPFQFEEVLARVKTHLTIVFQKRQLIEQREQIEAMRKRDQKRFTKITEVREQFVQAATHDLKNPIAIIFGTADLMQRFDEIRANPNLRDSVENIKGSAAEMRDLVTSMLDLVRMQSRFSLNLEDVDLGNFVQGQVAKHEAQALPRNIKLTYSAPTNPIPVAIDPSMMQRVIDNLVTNAIKYSPDDSGVEVIALQEDDMAVLHVIDEGFGMEADTLAKVFAPFYRAKKRDGERDIEGTGLGLSIVKEIVDQHNGKIQVYSTPGEGSTFSVYLPTRTLPEKSGSSVSLSEA